MSQIRIFFVTNRNYQPDNKRLVFGAHFNGDGVAALRFGHASFTVDDKTPKLDKVFVYPEQLEGTAKKVEGSSSFLDDLKAMMQNGNRDTIVYIHGFNVDFVEALTAGARLAHDIAVDGKPVNVVVFTWPSDGMMVPKMSYYSDREDARASGPAIARAFLKLRDFVAALDDKDYCGQRLHLLAHSMGNYVLRNGLQALIAKDKDSLVRLFDQIILAAADEDDDAFELDAKLRLLPRIGREVTLYYNPHDLALVISDKTKANPDRLGSDGPRMIDLLPKKVSLVDCRNVKSHGDKLVRHSYYLNSAATRADLGAVLNGVDPELIGNRQYILAKRAYRIERDPAA